MTLGSLFAGIGGFDLGFERAGFETVWQVEIDPYCRRVLERHFPRADRSVTDVRTAGAHNLARVDVICGGFPCQDVSCAGPRIGISGERSGLWGDMRRIVVVENVSGLLDRGAERVIGELAGIGYDAEWCVLSACSFGAPHPRERLFIVANAARSGTRGAGQLRRLRSQEKSPSDWKIYWPEVEPPCPRVVNGLPYRVDRLSAIGNAIVPQTAQYIAERIKAVMTQSPALPQEEKI